VISSGRQVAVYAFGEPVDMRKSFNTLDAIEGGTGARAAGAGESAEGLHEVAPVAANRVDLLFLAVRASSSIGCDSARSRKLHGEHSRCIRSLDGTTCRTLRVEPTFRACSTGDGLR
jgi:hypothetical protein